MTPQKAYYERHREEILTKAREKYKDPEVKQKRKKYIEENRKTSNDYHREYMRKYREKNREKYNEYQRAYRQLGKETKE